MRKMCKASKHAKNMFFDKKMHFSPKSQNAQHVHTCIILIWIQEVKDIYCYVYNIIDNNTEITI